MNGAEVDAVCDALGEALHKARGGKTMNEHVAEAVEMLEDDDTVGFQLVAIRESDDGYQSGFQRTISPEAVLDLPSDSDPEAFVEWMHDTMCAVYDEEVA